MVTLLEYLSTPNPELDHSNAIKGGNTFDPDWTEVDKVSAWDDFSYNNILHDFGDILCSKYEDLDWPNPLHGLDSVIVDETTVNTVLLKSNHIIVCCALKKAQDSSNKRVLTWALGVHAPLKSLRPDWAGVDAAAVLPRKNHVPGDSKVSGKWKSEIRYLANNKEFEFYKPVHQVVHYTGNIGTQFCYIISDKELIYIQRRVSEYDGSPLA